MAKTHNLMIKIASFVDSKFNNNVQKTIGGVGSINSKLEKLNQASSKIKSIDVKIKSFEKTQNQIDALKDKNKSLIKQSEEYKKALAGTSEGSEAYKEIKEKLKVLENEQKKVLTQERKLELQSETLTNQLKSEGINTKNLSSEKNKLGNKSKDLKNKIEQLTKSQNKNKKETKEQSDTFGKLTGKMKGLIIAGAGLFSLNAAKNFANESAALTQVQMKAETDLQAMLMNNKYLKGDTTAVAKAKADLMAYSGELQKIGVVGDEVTLAGQAQLLTFQLQSDSVKKLTPGILDMMTKMKGLNGTQEDAMQLGNMVGKVMMGQIGALSRNGVSFSKAQEQLMKYGDESQRAATLAQVLKENFGGANEALANTPMGSIQQVKNEIGDMKEEFGKGVLPIQLKFFQVIRSQMPNVSKLLNIGIEMLGGIIKLFENQKAKAFFDKIKIGVDGIVSKFQKMKPFISDIGSYLKNGISDKVSFIGKLITEWKPVFMNVFGALKSAFKTLWPVISTLFTNAWNLIKSVITVISPVLAKLVNGIVDIASTYIVPLIAKIGGFATGVIKVIRDVINVMSPMFVGIGTGAIKGIQGILDFITGVFTGNWKKAWEGVANVFSGIFDGIKGTIGSVAKLFGFGDNEKPKIKNNPLGKIGNVEKFALGGVANKPSIFGEAGPEMAIPLNDSKRSKGLWLQTGKILGLLGGNKKENPFNTSKTSPFSSEKIAQKNQSIKNESNSSSVNKFEIKFEINITGAVESVKQAKEIGKKIGESAAESFGNKMKNFDRNKGRLSFE